MHIHSLYVLDIFPTGLIHADYLAYVCVFRWYVLAIFLNLMLTECYLLVHSACMCLIFSCLIFSCLLSLMWFPRGRYVFLTELILDVPSLICLPTGWQLCPFSVSPRPLKHFRFRVRKSYVSDTFLAEFHIFICLRACHFPSYRP